MTGWIVAGAVVALPVVFLAVLLIRTARFRPKAQQEVDGTEAQFDRDGAVAALAACRYLDE